MTIEQSLEGIQPIIEQFQEKLHQETDIVCSFFINGKIEKIIYDYATKTLSKPFPDNPDDNIIFLFPSLDSKPIKIKID